MLVGLLILLGLSGYAALLLRQVRNQHQARQRALKERNDRILESINVIAHALENGQCGYSEGAIRLANLLNALQLNEKRLFSQEFLGIYGLYEQVKEMPTHQERQQLPHRERMQLDMKRHHYEAQFAAQLLSDSSKLITLQLN